MDESRAHEGRASESQSTSDEAMINLWTYEVTLLLYTPTNTHIL